MNTALFGLYMGDGSRGVDHPEDKPPGREQQDALPSDPARATGSGAATQCGLLVQIFWAANDDRQ